MVPLLSAKSVSFKATNTSPSMITASAPFDDEGDIILRSSDGVDFHVYKLVLMLASPWFRSMFSLQQSVDTTSSSQTPIIDVLEDEETLDCLLRYCYPIPDPVITGFELLTKTLEATLKYELLEATSICRRLLHNFMRDMPIGTYVLCWRLRLEEEAKDAAKEWKDILHGRMRGNDTVVFPETRSGMSFIPEMEDLPADVYQKLVQFVHGEAIYRFCDSASDSGSRETENEGVSQAWDAERVSLTYPFTLSDTDLVLRSIDGVEFPVHRLMLALNTHSIDEPGIFPLLSSPEAARLSSSSQHPILQAEYHSDVLGPLLQLVYPSLPGEGVSKWTSEKLAAELRAGVFSAARRSGLHSVAEEHQTHWQRHPDVDPVLLYRLAIQSGSTTAIQTAADRLAATRTWTEMLGADVTGLTAGQYHRLLRYIHQQRWIVSDVISSFISEKDEYAGTVNREPKHWLTTLNHHGRRAGITAALMESEGWNAWYNGGGYGSYKPDPLDQASRVQELESRIEQTLEKEKIEL